MKKRILVIGAATYQVPAIQRVKELGYEAYCVDYKEGQPGFAYADGYRIIDVRDVENCLLYAKELNIDGVLTWGATLTLPTVSYIASRLSLPCMPMEVSELSMNKYSIRKRLTEKGLNSEGDTFALFCIDDIKNHTFQVPFVVKPCDGSGSKGVRIVEKEEDIADAIQYAFDGARNNEIYIEPFVEGEEYSVEAYACGEDVYIYTIIKTDFYWASDFPVYRQTTYMGVDEVLESCINSEIEKAVRALNITFGPVNFDIIISKKTRKPYIIDVGIRNGQNLIASHIVPYSRGVDELNNSISLCLGNTCNPSPIRKKFISSRLLIYKPGVITKIYPLGTEIGKNGVVDIIMRKKEGEVLPSYQTKSDICGWVLAEGETPSIAQQCADAAYERLKDYIIIK